VSEGPRCVGVDDDLAARQPGVPLGPADDEPPRGVDVQVAAGLHEGSQ